MAPNNYFNMSVTKKYIWCNSKRAGSNPFACFLSVLLVSPLKHLEAVELKEVKLGETVALMCNLSVYFEIHWLKISEGRLMALMVTSLKHTGELSVVWNYNETHFEGFMEMQTTGLRILHVSTSDLATYYCATSYQKRLDFDKGVQLHSKCDISFLVKYGNIFIVILLLIFYLCFFLANQQDKQKTSDHVQGETRKLFSKDLQTLI